MKKLLIVYYSWSNGNTERIAKLLQSVAGGDLLKIDTAVPYPCSEIFPGAAVKKYPRESYYLATKYWIDANPDHVSHAAVAALIVKMIQSEDGFGLNECIGITD